MQQTTISKPPRVEVVDALRGFAVLAILLVHHVEHFIYPVYPDPATLPGWLNVLNEGVCLRWYLACSPVNRIPSSRCYSALPFIYSIRTSRRRGRTSVTVFFGGCCC